VTYIIIQDINQLKTKHPLDTWKTVVDDCDYFLILKTNDPDTKQWWSEQSGEQTIKVLNSRYSRKKTDIFGIHSDETITEGEGTRQVFTAGEIGRLKDDEVLLYVSQRNIVKLKTFFWKTHPYGKFLEKNKDKMYVLPAQHYPLWKLIEDGIVDENFDYDNEPTYVMELKKDDKIEIDSKYDPDRMLGIGRSMSININTILRKAAGNVFAHMWKGKMKTAEKKESINQSSAGRVHVRELKVVSSNGRQIHKDFTKSALQTDSVPHNATGKATEAKSADVMTFQESRPKKQKTYVTPPPEENAAVTKGAQDFIFQMSDTKPPQNAEKKVKDKDEREDIASLFEEFDSFRDEDIL
jgi:hypothetical protein